MRRRKPLCVWFWWFTDRGMCGAINRLWFVYIPQTISSQAGRSFHELFYELFCSKTSSNSCFSNFLYFISETSYVAAPQKLKVLLCFCHDWSSRGRMTNTRSNAHQIRWLSSHIPPKGIIVTSFGSSRIGWIVLLFKVTRKFLRTVTSPSLVWSTPNRRPMQLRGPSPASRGI